LTRRVVNANRLFHACTGIVFFSPPTLLFFDQFSPNMEKEAQDGRNSREF
jgi:hypothetical protein